VKTTDCVPKSLGSIVSDEDARLRVLIVDDEECVRGLVRRWIESWGYSVREAVSAVDALELLATAPSSIVLCDVRMPVHDGFWLTDRIRTRWPDIAIIIASGAQDFETVASIRTKGTVDFVPKPFARETLRQSLAKVSR
jgi:CheY-like chemotaxis protein